MKKQLVLGGLLAVSGMSVAQNNYFPSSGNAGVNLPSAPTEYNLQVKGSIGMQYGGIFGVTNTGWPASQTKIFQTGWDATNSDYLSFYTPGVAGPQNAQEKMRLTNNGNVGIGIANPTAKLHAVGTTLAIRGVGGSNVNDIGVYGSAWLGIEGIGSQTGVRGQANATAGAPLAIGVRGSTFPSANKNYGGYFATASAGSGIASYGIYTEVSVVAVGSTNYGIYSEVSGNHNGGTGPTYAGYFNGDVVTVGGSYFYSDKRLKKDIAKIDNSLSIIKQLNPVNYHFNREANNSLALSSAKQYGFISQEVQKVLPEFTETLIHPAKIDDKGNEITPQREVLGLNYNGFIAILTKGIQEQQEQIAELKNELAALRNEKATGISQSNAAVDGFALDQNIPNPFSNETVIPYNLPQQVSSASLLVYDLSGKQVAMYPITEKGAASLTITSEKLAAGIYIYSVMADGKILDSKRMVVAQK